jgi:hypothetical protein
MRERKQQWCGGGPRLGGVVGGIETGPWSVGRQHIIENDIAIQEIITSAVENRASLGNLPREGPYCSGFSSGLIPSGMG